MRIAQIKVYQFNELSEEAKEKAIEKLRDINVDYEWWDGELEDFKRELREIGIEAEEIFFDLNYGGYIYINKGGVFDERRLLKVASIDLRRREARDALTYGIELKTRYLGGGGGYNYFDPDNFPKVNICEWLKEKLEDFRKELSDTYDYLTTEEAVTETIEANEYEFLEEGELFRLRG